MKLRYVAITGADDQVDIDDLNAIAREYPFVEWALLLLPECIGESRCPSQQWIDNFCAQYQRAYKAIHLCGSALLRFAEGDRAILETIRNFKRIQLNLEFGDVEGRYDLQKLLTRIRAHPEHEFVIQYTDKRRNLLPELAKIGNHSLLFDASAGTGISPEQWPSPIPGHFCGYAGGLNPQNIQDNLEKIASVAGNCETWIDMESGVRTNDRFDLEKVRQVLAASKCFL